MDLRGDVLLAALCLLSVLCCVIPVNVLAVPLNSDVTSEADPPVPRDDERRATWLETRNLENNFKQLVYLSMQELASEGRIDPRLLSEKAPEKRGRHQGFCFKKTKSGRFLPYICWKGEGDNDEK